MPHVVDKTLRDTHVAVYAAILEAWLDYGKSPSKIELRDATRYSITTIQQVVTDLRNMGYIVAPKFQARSLRPTDFQRTLSNTDPDPWATLKTVKFWKADE